MSMAVVKVSFNGTEVTVKLLPNSMAKIIIDGAEFIITGQKPVQTGFYMKKYAFMDEPRDETVIFIASMHLLTNRFKPDL